MTESSSVQMFLNKPHKKYGCGQAAKKAKKTLANAFVGSSLKDEAQEKETFQKILDVVMSTKKGQETMTELSKLGYSFAFESGNFGGTCQPNKKKIVINPKFSFNYLLRVAVHEGQHAIQDSLKKEDCPGIENMQAASYLKRSRAIEADAVAHEAAFVHQLPEQYRDRETENDTLMIVAYGKEYAASKDEKKAMQAAFKSWYGYDYYRDFYDKSHFNNIKQIAGYGIKTNSADIFKKEMSNEDILRVCQYKGKPYIESEFLDSSKAFSVLETQKPLIVAETKRYADAVKGVKHDKSVLKMHSRDDKGNIINPPAVEKEDAKNVRAAVAVALNGKSKSK